MGGRARIDRQHRRGRLEARERLDRLFDPGTFFEIGDAKPTPALRELLTTLAQELGQVIGEVLGKQLDQKSF